MYDFVIETTQFCSSIVVRVVGGLCHTLSLQCGHLSNAGHDEVICKSVFYLQEKCTLIVMINNNNKGNIKFLFH